MVLLIFVCAIILCNLIYAVSINEIMFNPEGIDNNKEFVELIGTNNLSDHILGDLSSNDTLTLLQFAPDSNLSLIVEEGFYYSNYSELNCSIYSVGSTIGNNLDNDYDEVFLFYNNSIISNLSYYDSENNFTSTEIINNSQHYFSDNGTPCLIRTILSENTTNNESNLTNNNTNPTENMNEIIKCNTSIAIEFPKKLYENSEQIKYYNRIIGDETEEYEISYWIEDLWGNTIKKAVTTTNTNQKSYTPSIKTNEKVLVFKNKLKDECENGIKTSEEYIIVKIPEYEEASEEENNETEIEEYFFDTKEKIINDNLNSNIVIINKDSDENTYKIQHYLLKGTKKYSETETEIKLDSGKIHDEEILKILNLSQGSYDERVVIYKNNVKKKSFTRNIEIIREENAEISKNQKLASIKSFYTLAKKFDEEINLFANAEGNGDYSLLFGKIQEISKKNINSSEKMNYKVNISNGQNNFIIMIVDENNKIVDMKTLEINNTFNNQDDRKAQSTEQNSENKIIEIKNNKNNNNYYDDSQELTGNTIYNSNTKKVTKYLNYGLIPLIAIIIGLIIRWIHEKRKNKEKCITENNNIQGSPGET